MKSGDIEGLKRFKKEYIDCKRETGYKEVRPLVKSSGKGALDDEPF
jgi:hypothetical protein